MHQSRSIARSLGTAAVVLLAGCSWFHHKHDHAKAEAPAAEAAAAAPAEAAPAEPAAAAQAPASVAEDFYAMHQKLGNSGLPNSGAMNAYNAFLCPDLSAAIADAYKRQQQFVAEHPDDKPPLIEGDLFSSLFEGPESVMAGDTAIDGNSARVTLSMHAGEGSHATKWKDVVVLKLDDGIWCIDDVEYQGKWPFANHGRLSDTLKADF
jgi:hypothetical protein